MNEAQKTQLLRSFTLNGQLITNGTLIKDYINIIKKYKIAVQISIDGPKELNDIQRIYKDGGGSFDDIMRNIDICIKNEINWSVHGAVTAKGFNFMPAIFAFFWEISKKQTKGDIDKAIECQGSNNFQIIFEDNYSDKDIDNFLIGQEKVFNTIFSLTELSKKQKIKLVQNWFCRHGSRCVAGNTLFAVDADLNIYACHRPGISITRSEKSLGNLRDRATFKNFKLFNTFLAIDYSGQMYSAIKGITGDPSNANTGFSFQQNWCPAANLETSNSVFYQSAKYNLMIMEYDRFVRELFTYAKIPLPK